MDTTARIVSGDSSYEKLITRFIAQEFPSVKTSEPELTLELLSKIIVGTKETRYGSLPSPESLVSIRQVIRRAVELHLPIPILTPWGGKKAKTGERIDIAEVAALKQIDALNHRIQTHYNPGLSVRIRVEDVNAEY